MSAPNAPPSAAGPQLGNMAGLFQAVLDKWLQGLDDMLPARVVSYNRTTNRVRVQPLVKMMTTDGRVVSRAPIASVPKLRPGGGGFVLDFPLNPGDFGWIKANDRDISLILARGGEEGPATLRKHSFQDALFIPDVLRGMTLAGEDATAAVLQSLDGSVKVSLSADHLKLAAGGLSVTVGPESVTIVGPVEHTGTASITGAVTITGSLSVNGMDFDTHRHSGVQTGSGTSGGPVP